MFPAFDMFDVHYQSKVWNPPPPVQLYFDLR